MSNVSSRPLPSTDPSAAGGTGEREMRVSAEGGTRARDVADPPKAGRENGDFALALVALRPELRARALRLTRDASAAEDLVQDTVERAIRFREQFVPGTNLRSWAQTIVWSLFVTAYRRRRRERDAVRWLATDPCAWTSNDACTVDGLLRDLSPPIRRAVDALAVPFREVVLLVDVADLSYRDAADTLGIPIGTVMSRLHRARKQLAATLVTGEEKLAA